MTQRTVCVTGVAGAGKTHYAMGVIEEKLRAGVKWDQIAFCSFSRAARSEAAERAAKVTGESIERLTKIGWFRTLHSAALRCLGIDAKLILDHGSADGKKFLKEHLGAERGGEKGTLADRVEQALSWWDLCRAKLDNQGLGHTKNECVQNIEKHCSFAGHTGELRVSRMCPMCPKDAVATERAYREEDNEVGHMGHTGTHPGHTVSVVCVPLSANARVDETIENGVLVRACVRTRGDSLESWDSSEDQNSSLTRARVVRGSTENWIPIVFAYERAKKLHGRFDFSDILMKFAGYSADDTLQIHSSHQEGTTPDQLEVVLVDEAQDCSKLLWSVADRLSESSQIVYKLGDPKQCVYAFGGSDGALLEALERLARGEGNSVLLNRSFRNPLEVINWGEAVLEEDEGYESREPYSDGIPGSVGLMSMDELIGGIRDWANSDVLIVGRAEWNIRPVRKVLDELGIPWASTQEKHGSRWNSPAKIAFTLVIRELNAGDKISEQDWRRVLTELNQKWEGKELFERGVKAKWNKLECSSSVAKRLDELQDWGATEYFVQFCRTGQWKSGMPLMIDRAIDRYGIDCVRRPRIRVGTVHSVKGMQARNVFCLAASTQKCADADPNEERCLKYVAITRASRNYRLVVDEMDLARGKPLFWAAPKGERGFVEGVENVGVVDERSENPEGLPGLGEEDDWGSGSEISGIDLRNEGDSRCDSLRERQVRRDRVQEGRRGSQEASGLQNDAGPEEWWNL